ncbi:heat shock protein [Thecamonas trahens ATCC 50062]|uniref:Heat shock protein n=1 Tax=Thecamonas trahens ATCC 50062 TaxID=461836 RepID=A0A0L0D5N9_THETB|nr:heat shock protein [Thecamonas trahens ATCC 50062]KNC47687.1 heat shock protein [Thecamonas trahens ATCC 50062]|eukprot:XP_013759169.1 heat shock protein [Thecamonas trahens ATCC 50062]
MFTQAASRMATRFLARASSRLIHAGSAAREFGSVAGALDAQEEETHEFQAETRKLLDIVAKSLYSDKKVFVRELVSNASDALEKMRYAQVSDGVDVDRELKISIAIDEDAKTLTVSDSGIGMTKDELVENLGTIARSGTAAFVDEMATAGQGAAGDAKSNVIGRFGVGFYSAFIVGDHVSVTTRKAGAETGYRWSSDGSGTYTVTEAPDAPVGTAITIHLNADSHEFASSFRIKEIIKQFSNFVSFPIEVDGDRVNVIEPLWALPKSKVTDEQHTEFYQFIAGAYDEPAFRLQFSTDVPVDIKSLFYFPQTHFEYKFGSGRLEPGVQLYSRKVLIDPKPTKLLPEWLRFVKGVVDSEDLPLNLSREFTQDDALIANLNRILTKRILKHFSEELAADRTAYAKWFGEFGNFLKEGICATDQYKDALGKLMLFPTTSGEGNKTLDEVLEGTPEEQDKLYYVVAPSRELALASPYMDAFASKGTEVILLDQPVDEFVMRHLGSYAGKKLVSIESEDIGDEFKATEAGDDDASADDGDNTAAAPKGEALDGLLEWMKDSLGEKVSEVKATKRVTSAPALIVEHDSATMRQMIRMVGARTGVNDMEESYTLEINPKSPIISKLVSARVEEPDLALRVAQQVFDNAMISAGLLEDPRSMVKRLDALLNDALSKK